MKKITKKFLMVVLSVIFVGNFVPMSYGETGCQGYKFNIKYMFKDEKTVFDEISKIYRLGEEVKYTIPELGDEIIIFDIKSINKQKVINCQEKKDLVEKYQEFKRCLTSILKSENSKENFDINPLIDIYGKKVYQIYISSELEEEDDIDFLDEGFKMPNCDLDIIVVLNK